MASRFFRSTLLPARIERVVARSSARSRDERARAAGLSAFRKAEEAIAARPARELGKRAVRIPTEALVSIGPAALPAPPGRLRLAAPRSANDNVAPGAAGKRSLLRELFFLAVLFTTLVGAFYSGKIHGFQKVIVVPEPWSQTSDLS